MLLTMAEGKNVQITFCRTEPRAVCAVPYYSSGSSIQNGWQNTHIPECLYGKCLSSVSWLRADFNLWTDFITSGMDLCLFYLRKCWRVTFLHTKFSLALYVRLTMFYPFEHLLAKGSIKMQSHSYLHVSVFPKTHISVSYTIAAPQKHLSAQSITRTQCEREHSKQKRTPSERQALYK